MGKKEKEGTPRQFELNFTFVELAASKEEERKLVVDDLPEINIAAWQEVREFWNLSRKWKDADPRLINYAINRYHDDWEDFMSFFQSTGSISEADEAMSLDET